VLGSVADEVRREAGVPVLVIPSGAPQPLGTLRLLACIDESAESESALAVALELGQNMPAAITVLEVVPGTQGAAAYRNANAHLARLAQTARTLGTCVSTAVSRGDPAREIVSMAGVLNANVIAVASRGRSGVARAVLGSVAGEVITVSQTPVLLTPRAILSGRGNRVRALSAVAV
jgi:nucleotide-binding universal stress UspA family protein